MAFYTEKEKYFKKDVLSYHTCKDIYRTSVMGKRVVEALVNFSMSAERDISIQKAPPEAVEHFKYIAKQLRQNESIKKTIYNARIYGTGALFVALHNIAEDKDDFTTKPNFNDAENYDIRFNVLDPQNIAGSTFDSNPASFHFLELIDIKVDNQLIPRKRIAISHALEPLYLDNRTSLIPYSPPSVFYNMIDLLKDYDQAIEALDNLLYKAGAIIYKYKAGGKFSGIQLDAIKRSSEILEQKRNGAVISIDNQCEIQDFPINNVNGLIESVNKLEDAITKALNDTPASLLFDKSLSNGFSEGDKDKETEISIIEAFRENKLTPLYTLTDYYVMLKAFDNDFINEMKDKYSDLKDKSNTEIFYEWCNSFKYEFGNLFPEPESKTIENNSKKLDNLIKLQQLGANAADIEAELNEDEIFKNEMDLDGQQPNFDIDNDNDMIDANMLGLQPAVARIDDSDVPAGFEWKTLPNGEHVLINSSTGEVVSGAGIENWKDTGKMTMPQPKPEPKVLNNKEWRALEEKIADAEDDVEFYTKALEGAENERQVAAINRNINEAKERAAKLKEEMANSKKAGINAEKDKDKIKNSKKKITKNYSISYDNETIDKLKSLGKVWQDKRIYFKELDNGYYDLENEKWVTDSPALTEKALTIAGETTEEKTARLENERIAEEQRKEAERIAKETAKKERQAREKPIAMRVYDKLRDRKTFDNQMFKAMNEAGIFEEFSIPKGSINAITDKLFTEEEQDAWKGIDKSDSDFSKLNDTYKYWQSHPLDNLKDFIFENVKSELNHINDMYKPMKWGDWLWQEKDLNNGSQSVDDLEDITDEDPDLIREDLNYKYIKNSVAWEKFGKEFEEYKKNYRKTASAKVREYIENKLSGMESGTGKVDSKVYIDNFVDNFIRFADIKIDAKEDLEWKTLKSNGEHVLINSSTGEVVSGAGGALSKDKDKDKDNKDKSKENQAKKKINKPLDNSENKDKIKDSNAKSGQTPNKQGDNDGRQQQQSNSETYREQRNEQRRQAFAKIQGLDSRRLDGGMSVFDKRRGGNSSQDGLVEYTIEAKPEIKSIFEGVDIPTPSFNQLKKNDNKAIDTFKNALSKVKQSLGDYGASVELKDDYTDINLYLSEDGESGFAIKPNGDIVSLFSSDKAERGQSHYMLEMATAEGGRQLDCFDIYLTKIYEAHGFKPVAKIKWNDEYIPEGWNKENFKKYNNGEPDVVFMVYDPDNYIEKYKGKRDYDIPEIIDYDDGEKFQHIYKWRSPAEREAICNNMLERYKQAKTTEELKKVVYDKDKPIEVFERQSDDLNHLNKEQRDIIKEEYTKRYMELLKDEDPERYKQAVKELKAEAKAKAKQNKADTQIYINNND